MNLSASSQLMMLKMTQSAPSPLGNTFVLNEFCVCAVSAVIGNRTALTVKKPCNSGI